MIIHSLNVTLRKVTGGVYDKTMTRKEMYEILYYRCEKRSPGLKPVIDFIKEKSDIDKKERSRLYAELSNGSIVAKQRFTEFFMRTALQMAYLFSIKTGIEIDELFSIAYEAIVNTLDQCTFKSEKKLYLYVSNNIRTVFMKYMKEFNRSVPLEYVLNLGYDGEKAIIEYIHNKALIEVVEKTEILSDEERTIIMSHLNLSGYGQVSMTTVAKKLNLKSAQNAFTKYRKGLRKIGELGIFQELHSEAKPIATACAVIYRQIQL